MRTISQHVRTIVEESPLLTEVLSLKIGNHTEIARQIKTQVESLTLEPVTLASICMALGRLENILKRPTVGSDYLKEMKDITVRSDLIEFVYPNSPETAHIQRQLSEYAHKHNDFFFTLIQGIRETLVLAPKKHIDPLTKVLESQNISRTIPELSLITIRLPEESLDVPGVYYPVLQALARRGVNFIEIISVATELSILVEDSEVHKAFSILKQITSRTWVKKADNLKQQFK